MKTTESLNSDEGAEYQIRCLACQNETRHHVVTSLIRFASDGDWWWKERFQIVRCGGCLAPAFRYEKEDPDSPQTDWDTGENFLASEVRIFPPRDTRTAITKSEFLPFAVKDVYREVLLAIAADLPVLAAIGLRTIVEAACRDLGGSGRLVDMINGLVSSGRLRGSEGELLHKLRDAGNASAHKARSFRKEQLLEALWAVEHILTSVYLLSHHRQNLPAEGA